ncbi:response regulator transcription factor [bacterium]|nr:MAG: response regulator transcription factor [bacterium]
MLQTQQNQSYKNKHILIVEDEPSLVFTLQDTLENEGYQVSVTHNGNDALAVIAKKAPDLMLLDIMLPGMSGYEICKKVREDKHLFPIIMLTARDQEIDKVTGLNIGADDYITKPFGVKELLARIQARLRRSHTYVKTGPISELQLGEVKVDLINSVAVRPDGNQELTTREVELIRYLYAYANEPVSRDALLEHVWRYEFSTNTRTVDVHVSKLRSKIELKPEDPHFLVTLHGVGYMLKNV